MSARDRRPEALVLDPGVLREGPVCEFGSAFAVEAQGGVVVTPWRDRFRAAETAEIEAVADSQTIPDASYAQVIVHVQKSRAATYESLSEAWRILSPGGQFLVAGSNAVGVTSFVKKLGEQLAQTAIVATNRARARVVRFKRDAGPGPKAEDTPSFEARVTAIDGTEHVFQVDTRPGVFSAKKLDAGSELLLARLPRFIGHKSPKRIVDLGCGTGVLGIASALLYPEAELLFADGDARAVACTRANLERLGLADRARVEWWDAREAPLGDRFQLALVNPPFHQHGPEVDLGPALALFDSLSKWLGRNGRALVVANRTLPYEAPLSDVGEVETLETARGYKLFSLKRSGRSSGARGRSAPGGRSAGRSNRPMRSR